MNTEQILLTPYPYALRQHTHVQACYSRRKREAIKAKSVSRGHKTLIAAGENYIIKPEEQPFSSLPLAAVWGQDGECHNFIRTGIPRFQSIKNPSVRESEVAEGGARRRLRGGGRGRRNERREMTKAKRTRRWRERRRTRRGKRRANRQRKCGRTSGEGGEKQEVKWEEAEWRAEWQEREKRRDNLGKRRGRGERPTLLSEDREGE